ncbi:hypothetical protein KF913_14315 [Candidatus Obscuribacterales bacterium]|nr:hypothetical protein [Candidatus Obscuribacterales bacterium]
MKKSNSRCVAVTSATVALTVALALLSGETACAGDDPFAPTDEGSSMKTVPRRQAIDSGTFLKQVSNPVETKPAAKAVLEQLPPGEPLQVGFDLLKKLEYERALAAFNIAARTNPTAAEPHFGRAKALLGLQRRDEALKEFKLCTLLDPSASNTEKCDKEIEYYTAKAPAGAPLTVTSEDIEKSSTRVTNQASSRISQIHREAAARGLYLGRSSLGSKSSKYRHIPVPAMPSSSLSLNGGGGGLSAHDYFIRNGTLSGYDSRAYSRSRRYDAAAKADDARRRAEAVRDAAIGLNQAMSTKPSDSSGVYLSPHGTNLYVRNYVNFDPVKQEPVPTEALSAKQMSIDTTGGAEKPAKLPAKPSPLDPQLPSLDELVNSASPKSAPTSHSNK